MGSVTRTAIALFAAGAASLWGAVPRGNDVFSGNQPIELTIRAPLSDLIAQGREISDYSVAGVVSYKDPASGSERQLDGVEIGVRGHTSLVESECEFPKLKLK